MATGTPILASRAGSIPEICGDAALYFDTHNLESLEKELEKIISSEDIQKSLVQKGFERIKDFSWERTAQQTLDIIKNA